MKPATLLYVFVACAAFFSSCSETEPDPEPVATFSFLVDGTLVEWNGSDGNTSVCVLCGPGIMKAPTSFTLSSSAAQDYGEAIILTFDATTIDLATYSDTITTAVGPLEASHRLYLPSLHAASTEVGDFATVTFTSVQGGEYYDGTFRARLTASPYGTASEKVEIEGEFQNVKAN